MALKDLVSIRAPAWGATLRHLPLLGQEVVSIRAPAWGATLTKYNLGEAFRFQFALPRGERPMLYCIMMCGYMVSIRAPAWGATLE